LKCETEEVSAQFNLLSNTLHTQAKQLTSTNALYTHTLITDTATYLD